MNAVSTGRVNGLGGERGGAVRCLADLDDVVMVRLVGRDRESRAPKLRGMAGQRFIRKGCGTRWSAAEQAAGAAHDRSLSFRR
jgi:hypothetical protein